MQLVKCDRCGAFKPNNQSWCGMTVYIPDQGQMSIDLCPSCAHDFTEWMDYISEETE